MTLEIVEYPSEVLTMPARKLTPEEIASNEIQNLIDEMIEMSYQMGALGLAAPQIGKNISLAVYRSGPGEGFDVLINADYQGKGGKVYSYGEGCLSSPGQRFDIKRFKSVVVDYQNRSGEPRRLKSRTKMEAFVLQHEVDHLRGITLAEYGKEQ